LFGELQPLPHVSLRAGLALLYLIVCGSLLGFTAFVWLLARMPATRVASHAYVNPIVAVALGYFVAGEAITLRTLAGTALVIASVFLILRPGKLAGDNSGHALLDPQGLHGVKSRGAGCGEPDGHECNGG
jgi:drug/metabolite transporter (DMT)-like permease